jgi:hypothetical protein
MASFEEPVTAEECLIQLEEKFGGPGRVRTVDLFHAMEARSQLRHRPLAFLLLNGSKVSKLRATVGMRHRREY